MGTKRLWIGMTGVAFALALATAVARTADPVPASVQDDGRILFENDHIRFVEVTRWPGETIDVGAVPRTAVVATDAPWPTVVERSLAPSVHAAVGNSVTGPDGLAYPSCHVETPLPPRRITVTGKFPQHFYRVEYKRIDGPDLAANWRTWYPWTLDPAPKIASLGKTLRTGAPFSRQWPFSYVYRPETAAPANHYVRFEDEHVQLLEVVVRPGEEENVHGHPYRTIYADDGGFAPPGGGQDYYRLDPKSQIPFGKTGNAPNGAWPICKSSVPSGPHRIINTKGPLNHFYRVQFKRIDGDGIRTGWRGLYSKVAPTSAY